MNKDLFSPLQGGYLLSGALAQPTSEEIMRNVDNSPWQVDDQIMQNALGLGQEEELKEPAREAVQQIDLVPQDQEYSDVIDIRDQDQQEIQQDFDQEYADAMAGITEATNLIEQAGGIPEEVPQDERDSYIDFIRRYIQYLRDRLQMNDQQILELLAKLQAIGYQIMIHWQERQLKHYKPNTQRDSSDNQRFHQETEQRSLPKQCQRRYYVDSQGVMRSIVICESFGSQRIYHDR